MGPGPWLRTTHWSNCVSNVESQDFLWIFPMAILREGAYRGQSHFPLAKYFATYLLPHLQEYLLMYKCSLQPVGFIWLGLVWHLHSAYKMTMLEVYYLIDISKQLSCICAMFYVVCCREVRKVVSNTYTWWLKSQCSWRQTYLNVGPAECTQIMWERKLSWWPAEKQRQRVRGHKHRALKRKK